MHLRHRPAYWLQRDSLLVDAGIQEIGSADSSTPMICLVLGGAHGGGKGEGFDVNSVSDHTTSKPCYTLRPYLRCWEDRRRATRLCHHRTRSGVIMEGIEKAVDEGHDDGDDDDDDDDGDDDGDNDDDN